MKQVRFAAFFAVAALLCAQESSAQTEKQDVNGWTIITQPQPQSEIDPLCIIRSPSSASDSLQITNPLYKRVRGSGNASFFIYTSKMISESDKEALPDSVISIDGKELWKKNMQWIKISEDKGAITGLIEDNVETIIRPFSNGRTVSLAATTAGGVEHRFTVSLTGSTKALAEYEKCLSKVRIAPE